MIHHLIASSPYTTRFMKLLEDHPDVFPPQEHRFWIEGARGSGFRVEDRGRIPRTDVGAWGFLRAFQALGQHDRIVIHQLSNPRLLLYLFVFRAAARRCAWAVWGGDVYYYRSGPRTSAHAWRERLRRSVIPLVPVISSMVPGDVEVVRNVYGSRAKYVRSFYPIPMDHDSLDVVPAEPRGDRGFTILVGNSGDPANDHAGVFSALSRFRGEGVRVVSPLSYGDRAYVASVIGLGRESFGDRFTPLTDFLPPEQYARLIRDVDVAIMNHGYQQALGNIIALLLMGKKVFVRSDTTPFRYFNDLDVSVFDTLRVPQMSLAEIAEFSTESGWRNSERVREHLSEANAVAGWRALFDTLRGVT